jgi:hypothetical protein
MNSYISSISVQINRRSLLIPWALLIALFVVMIRQSVSYGMTRLAIVVIGIVVIAGLLYFLWKQTIVRWSTIEFITGFSIFLMLPGNLVASKDLQPNYGAMLRTYGGAL